MKPKYSFVIVSQLWIKVGRCVSKLKRLHPRAYDYAVRNNMLEAITAQQYSAGISWNYVSVAGEAKRHPSLRSFKENAPEAYLYAAKSCCLQMVLRHTKFGMVQEHVEEMIV